MSKSRKTILFFQTGSPVLARRKLAGVTAFAQNVDWRIVVPERTGRRYALGKLVRAYRPDGVIAECSGAHDEFTRAALGPTPVVYLCRDPDEVLGYADVVTNDSPACGRLAAGAFADAGLRSVAFVGSHGSVYWSDRKRDGFLAAAAERGLAPSVFASRPADERHPLAWRRRLVAWLRTLPKPVGIFTVSDEFGLAVVEACQSAGLSVPDVVSVIAVNDDETLCEASEPTLTSIRLDYEQTGRIAAERLFGRITVKTGAGTATTVPPVGLTRRASLAAVRHKDTETERAIEFIRRRATEGIAAADVIARYACSRRTAELRFAAVTGHTPAEAIVCTRIEHAKRLLEHGEVAIGSVAMLSGWRSETLFRRQFKSATGQTPLDYRRRFRA